MACDDCDPWSERNISAMFAAYEKCKNSDSAMDRYFAGEFERFINNMMKPFPPAGGDGKIIKWETT